MFDRAPAPARYATGMKRRFHFLLLILAVLALAASAAKEAGAATGQAAFARVRDAWQVAVSDREAIVRRTVEMDEQIAPLVRGSGALQAASLASSLEAGGAAHAACSVTERRSRLTVNCRYHQPLTAQEVTLPDDGLLYFLLDLPVSAAQGIQVDRVGELTVPGLVGGLPGTEMVSLGDGSSHYRRYGLSSLSTLVMVGETRLAPGQLPFAPTTPVVIPYLPQFQPRPSAWLALMGALAVALLAVSRLLPVHARLPLRPQLWQPDPGQLPRPLRPLFALVVRLVHGLQRNWPFLLNAGVGGALLGLGAQTLLVAWGLARVHEHVRGPGEALPAGLPLLPPVRLLTWPGLPLAIGAMGALLLVMGAGMLARRETARLLVTSVLVALAGGLLLVWPHILLAPPLFPIQLELALASGSASLFALVLFARGLMHPRFRCYYLGLPEYTGGD